MSLNSFFTERRFSNPKSPLLRNLTFKERFEVHIRVGVAILIMLFIFGLMMMSAKPTVAMVI